MQVRPRMGSAVLPILSKAKWEFAQSRFQLGEELGSGVFGKTIAALDCRTRECAVKIFHPPRVTSQTECAALKRVSAHSGAAPRPYEYGLDYIVMELVHGETLDKWMARHDGNDLISSLLAYADLIDVIHGLGVVHGDLLGKNIVISRKGLVAVDFGHSGYKCERWSQVEKVVHQVERRLFGRAEHKIKSSNDVRIFCGLPRIQQRAGVEPARCITVRSRG